MLYSTGLTDTELDDLVSRLAKCRITAQEEKWPGEFGLRNSLIATLRYLRGNRRQHDIAETMETSQSTISRAIKAITILLVKVLRAFFPTLKWLSSVCVYIVDGTLLPCWSYKNRRCLYSGKHKKTGMNVQVAVTLEGRVAWLSKPYTGNTHDLTAIRNSGLLKKVNPNNVIADKGYQCDEGILTPIKKPKNGELTENDKEFNRQIHQIRWVVEQKISHLKNWLAFKEDYRRPYSTIRSSIRAVICLYTYLHS